MSSSYIIDEEYPLLRFFVAVEKDKEVIGQNILFMGKRERERERGVEYNDERE